MHYEENYMTYVENEGYCGAVTCKLRKKRHLIIIIVLLSLAIVSLVVGMYNGLAIKKYSNLALVVGIFFPSIILVFVCVYLAFICGRESFRTSVLLQARGNHPRHSKNGLQYPQTNSATREDLRHQSKMNADFVNDPLAIIKEPPPFSQVYYTKNDSTDYCEAKISKRHFRSFSNSDISRRMPQNHNAHSSKSETNNVTYGKNYENQCSPTCLRHRDVPHSRGFKRSVSDTTNRNKKAKSREDRCVWNTQSLHKLRNNVDRLNSVQDAKKESCKYTSEVRKKQTENSLLRSNFKTTVEYGNRAGFKEDFDHRYTKRQEECIRPQEDFQKKSCYTKSEIRLYSSSVPSCKYKQTFKISSFQSDIKDIKGSGDAVSSSLSEDENGSISLSDILKMERKKMENKRLGNFTSEQDAYRRKTIYFPSTSNATTRNSREYAHEYCRYSNIGSKMKYHLPSRNEENFGDTKSIKQMRFHKR